MLRNQTAASALVDAAYLRRGRGEGNVHIDVIKGQ